jgi:hypothetical protein
MVVPFDEEDLRAFRDGLVRDALDRAGAAKS